MNGFNLKIVAHDRLFFEGEAEFVSFRAADGEVGLLKSALPRITPLKEGIIRITQNKRNMEAITGNGFVYVSAGGVTVLADECIWPHEALTQTEAPDESDKKALSERDYKMTRAQIAGHMKKLKGNDKEI